MFCGGEGWGHCTSLRQHILILFLLVCSGEVLEGSLGLLWAEDPGDGKGGLRDVSKEATGEA